MKRLIIYCLLFAAALFVPVERTDVAQLQPIESIGIYQQGSQVIIRTDTGDLGIGSNVSEALTDLYNSTPAVVYLDTARYLLVGDGALEAAEEMRGTLKNSVRLCMAQEEVPLMDASRYLSVHGELPEFRRWQSGDPLPYLYMENERIKMSEKSEKIP